MMRRKDLKIVRKFDVKNKRKENNRLNYHFKESFKKLNIFKDHLKIISFRNKRIIIYINDFSLFIYILLISIYDNILLIIIIIK
jgi:hypothetical protein